MDDKENRTPSLEMKRERMLQKLQRRNSATSAKDFASSAASSVVTKADECETIETKALVAWVNAVLAPSGDDVDADGKSEVEALLDKDNCGKQLKEMLASSGSRVGAYAAKRDPSAGGEPSQTNSSSGNGNGSGGMLKYFMKRASHANLAKKLEELASDKILGAIQCLVIKGKIGVREEIKVHTNLGVQTALCQALLSFQPVWLRLALEFVCGRRVQLPRTADGRVRYVAGMSAYIHHYLFADYSIIDHNRKFCHGNNKRMLTPAGVDAMQKNFLAKFLCILYLIELMLTRQLLPDVPCMFWPSSKLKSINDVLALLSRELLSGGSAVKALQQADFHVSYQQGFFEEYRYVVNNFQTDLGDGVILAKIVEVLAAKRGRPLVHLTGRLRNPAGDRLRKVYNVRYVLDECAAQFPEQFGDGNGGQEFNADDVVAGKRDVLVELVWRLIGVVLGDEVTDLRCEFVAKYQTVAAKPQSAAVSGEQVGLELPLLVEMRRLNATAGRIQTWWRRRHTIRATLTRARAVKAAAEVLPSVDPISVSVPDAGQPASDARPMIQPQTEANPATEAVAEPPATIDDLDENTLRDETEGEGESVDEEEHYEVGDADGVASDVSLLHTSSADGFIVSEGAEAAVHILQSTTVTIYGCRTPSAASVEEPEDEEAYATANESYDSVACRDLSLGSSADRRLSSASYAGGHDPSVAEDRGHDLSLVNDRSIGAELTILPDTIESVANDFLDEDYMGTITVTMTTSPVRESVAAAAVEPEDVDNVIGRVESTMDAKESPATRSQSDGQLLDVDVSTSSSLTVAAVAPTAASRGPKLEVKGDDYESSAMLDKALNITENTLVARQIAARPRAQSDGATSFSTLLTYEEFRRNLDKRRREMRLVGIPMRADPLKALRAEPKVGGGPPPKLIGSQQPKTNVGQTPRAEPKAGGPPPKSNVPRPKPTGSHQKQSPKTN